MTTDANRQALASALLDEAISLSSQSVELAKAIVADGKDFVRALFGGRDASTNERTKSIFQSTVDLHTALIPSVSACLERSGVLIVLWQRQNIIERIKEVQTRLRQVDPVKLAVDEEHVALCRRAADTVFRSGDELAVIIASGQIASSALVLQHAGVMRAFLGRPTPLEFSLNAAVKLLKAGVKEVAGRAVPAIGLLELALEITRPQIEKDLEKIRRAVGVLDRLFYCEDTLRALTAQATHAQATIEGNVAASNEIVSAFQRDAKWLLSALEAARR